ncbi:MAG TPA: DUF167 domain-containing protein [Candidatus Paceibacterota bacterium]
MQYIHVKVIAGARKESFQEKSDDHFEVSVKEKAERNMANARILELVALYFKVSVNKVRIINGHRSPSKLLVLD